MTAVQNQLIAVKDEHRCTFQELAQREALYARDLELFLERAEGPAWMEEAPNTTAKPNSTRSPVQRSPLKQIAGKRNVRFVVL